jgi:hypothetical protein
VVRSVAVEDPRRIPRQLAGFRVEHVEFLFNSDGEHRSYFLPRSRGPRNEGAEIVAHLGPEEPIVYLDRKTTPGVILAHSGNDLWDTPTEAPPTGSAPAAGMDAEEGTGANEIGSGLQPIRG